MKNEQVSVDIGNRCMVFSTSKIAKQANGSVVLNCEDTMILSTVCVTKEIDKNTTFFPLTVDYQEKFSGAGRTLGGFIKREGRPSERETLTSRLIDRPLRPFFPKGFYNATQSLNYVLSFDQNAPPDPLAICSASAAFLISDIPFEVPIGAVCIGHINDKFIVNPSVEEQKISQLNLIIAGTVDNICMVQCSSNLSTIDTMIAGMEVGHEEIKKICKTLAMFREKCGKKKLQPQLLLPSNNLIKQVEEFVGNKKEFIFSEQQKKDKEDQIALLSKETLDYCCPEGTLFVDTIKCKNAIKDCIASFCRKKIVDTNKRSDGRSPKEIRNITVDMGILPRAHGSCLFSRGETQTISVCTLGNRTMGQRYEDITTSEGIKNFYLQYSFPPFCVGEVKRIAGPARREIGHGKLAESALKSIVPSIEKFPYTIRLESTITESNGSSSMATVCGCALAMIDAGVPISTPIVGIAMGLIIEDDKSVILSDISSIEDFVGDMDFKVTGDGEKLTELQMDTKSTGINTQFVRTVLEQAMQGCKEIVDVVCKYIPKSKKSISQYAPKIKMLKIPQSQIGIVVGPKGNTIKSIIEETGVDINIDNEGLVTISSLSDSNMEDAMSTILALTNEIESGKIYKGTVKTLKPFGAFIAIAGSTKQGLCHISEMSEQHVKNIEDVVKETQEVNIKVLDITPKGIKLSMKGVSQPIKNNEGI